MLIPTFPVQSRKAENELHKLLTKYYVPVISVRISTAARGNVRPFEAPPDSLTSIGHSMFYLKQTHTQDKYAHWKNGKLESHTMKSFPFYL